MNKIALWKNVPADDWTAKRAIIASNELTMGEGRCESFYKIHSPSQ